MRIETSYWLGREFLSISGEGPEIGDPEAEADALFASFDEVLAAHGLSLDNTIRSRIWGADSDARTACSTARARTLSGRARAATSSYVAPAHFNSATRVAMDLVALLPLPGEEKTVTEQDPPKGVIKWLAVGELLVLPGMSCNEVVRLNTRRKISWGGSPSAWAKPATAGPNCAMSPSFTNTASNATISLPRCAGKPRKCLNV